MAVTPEDILTRAKGPAIVVGVPIDSSLPGAPPTIPGSGSSEDKTTMTGAPVQSATIPQPFISDIDGAPNAGQTITSPVSTPKTPTAGTPTVVQTETDVEHVTPVPEQQTAPEKKKLSYVELFQQMSPYKPPTPEELEKERKKQKREAIFAAIGEGISAMSNLYFTTQYAPNAFVPSKGMAARTRTRFDRLKKEREDNQRQYMDGFMRAMRWDAENERERRNWQHTLEREKITDEWREELEGRRRAKEEFEAQKRGLDLKYLQGKIDRQKYLEEQDRLEAVYMGQYGTKMPTRTKSSSVGVGASGGRSGEGSGMKRYPAYNPSTGETIEIIAKDSKHAWSQCPQGFTIRQEPSASVKETTSGSGRRTKTTHEVTTKNSNENLDGPRRGGNSGSGSKKKTNVQWK